MREMSWSKKTLLAAGVAVVTLGLAAPAAADELTDVSPLTTPHRSQAPAERPPAVPDAESPAEGRQEIGAREARTESASLPAPADDVVLPTPADGLLGAAVEDYVIGGIVVISLAPRPLRRPRHLP